MYLRLVRSLTQNTATALILALALTFTGGSPADAAPAAPAGLSPNGGSVTGIPVLQWSRVSGATSYDVEVSSSSTFTTTAWRTSTTNRRATPTIQLPVGQVWWRVRAANSTGAGSWSTASFSRSKIAGPTLT